MPKKLLSDPHPRSRSGIKALVVFKHLNDPYCRNDPRTLSENMFVRVKTTRRSLAPIEKVSKIFVVAIPGKVVEAFDGPEVPEVSVKAEVERIFAMGIGWGLPQPWQLSG